MPLRIACSIALWSPSAHCLVGVREGKVGVGMQLHLMQFEKNDGEMNSQARSVLCVAQSATRERRTESRNSSSCVVACWRLAKPGALLACRTPGLMGRSSIVEVRRLSSRRRTLDIETSLR